LAAFYRERIQRFTPAASSAMHGRVRAVGVNERLRVLKYTEGQFFSPHRDGSYTRGPEAGQRQGEASHTTAMVDLNGGFAGGRTALLHPDDETRRTESSRPRGPCLVFGHGLYHAGEPVVGGTKYAIRTGTVFTAADDGQLPGHGGWGGGGPAPSIEHHSVALGSQHCRRHHVPAGTTSLPKSAHGAASLKKGGSDTVPAAVLGGQTRVQRAVRFAAGRHSRAGGPRWLHGAARLGGGRAGNLRAGY
jgi:hypothetical protein